MYSLRAEHSFDSAHFLAGYEGKCSNIHGHRWLVIVEIKSETLQSNHQCSGMIVDFSELKNDIKVELDFLDHALIVEKNTLKDKTVEALNDEGFKMIFLDFRPTAENFAKYFYDKLTEKEYNVKSVTVFETPTNSAMYESI